MRRTYEIECHPPNLPVQIVRLEAATLDEALQRADNLWVQQRPRPRLLRVLDDPTPRYPDGITPDTLELLAGSAFVSGETSTLAKLELLRRLDIHSPWDVIRAAETALHEEGRHVLADELYGVGCALASERRATS